MALTKNKMVSEIGRRTRLRNHDVQRMLESLIDVWCEELASGGRIELQNFLVLEVQRDDGPDFVTVVEAGLLAKTGFNSSGIGLVVKATGMIPWLSRTVSSCRGVVMRML